MRTALEREALAAQMRLLALDQASNISGYSIWDNNQLEKVGKIRLDGQNIDSRLVDLRNEVKKLIFDNKITEAAIEDIQMQSSVGNNAQTFKVLAEVMGVLIELFKELDLPYEIISSNTWKSTCKIPRQGRAKEKRAAQEFALERYGQKVTQDEADAICIGHHCLSKNFGFNWAN